MGLSGLLGRAGFTGLAMAKMLPQRLRSVILIDASLVSGPRAVAGGSFSIAIKSYVSCRESVNCIPPVVSVNTDR